MGTFRLMKRKYFLISVFLTLVFSIFTLFLWNLYLLHKNDRLEQKRLKGFVECGLQHESSPMETDLEAFRKLYESLKTYDYMEIYGQPLDFLQNGREHFDAYTDQWTAEAERIKAMQVSPDVLEEFQLTVEQGGNWEKSEILLDKQGQKIPVILGAGYSGIYEIGDTFVAEYLYDPYEFTVIGILQPRSTIYTGRGGLIDLDSVILLPSFSVTEEYPVTDGLKIHYANKTSGYIKLERETYLEEYLNIQELAKAAGAGEYSFNLSSFSAFFRNRFGISLTAAFAIVMLGSVGCGIAILCLLHKIRLEYGGYARYYVWLFSIPVVSHLILQLFFWDIRRLMWDLGIYFLAVGLLLLLHFLSEMFFQRRKRHQFE